MKKLILTREGVITKNGIKGYNELYNGPVTEKALSIYQTKARILNKKFTAKGYNIWAYMDNQIIGNSVIVRMLGFPSYFQTLLFLIAIKNEIKRIQPDIVECKGCTSSQVYVLKEFAKSNSFTLTISNTKKESKRLLKIKLLTIKGYLLLRVFLRWMLGKFSKACPPSKVIILTNDRFCGKLIEKDQMFGYLIEQFKRESIDFKIIKFDRFKEKLSWLKILKEIKKADYNYIGNYYNIRSISEDLKLAQEIEIKWKELIKSKEFKALYEIEGIDLYPLFKEYLSFICPALSLFIADSIITTKKVLQIEKPKIVIIDSEANFVGKGFILNSAKVIALQFGPILNSFCDISPSSNAIPYLKCVGNNNSKKVLEKTYKYPENRVIVTGEPRYDFLIKNNWSKERILNSIGLDKDTKTILFIDSGGAIRENSYKLAKELREVALSNPIQLIVKLHPNPDPVVVRSYMKELSKIHRVAIVKQPSISQLIFASDVVVGISSTALIEALAFGKPIIILKLLNWNQLSFAKEKYVLAINPDELNETLRKVFNKPNYVVQLRKKLKKIAEKELYQPKEGSAKKITEIVKNVLNGNMALQASNSKSL